MSEIIDLDVVEEPKKRRGDGGTYLVVADDSDEFRTALVFACKAARDFRAHVGILHVIEEQDFQGWGAVENRMKKELREAAEKYLWTVAKIANDTGGIIPSLYIAEGERGEAVLKVIDGDEHIVRLILGGRTEGTPGPLVSFCVGKGLARLRVPVVIVPGHMKDNP